MINEKIKLRYQMLWEKYKRPTIGKKEYAEIYSISVSTIDKYKYIASGGINLVPYKKQVTEISKLVETIDIKWLRGLDLNYHIEQRNPLITLIIFIFSKNLGQVWGKVILFTIRIYNASSHTLTRNVRCQDLY